MSGPRERPIVFGRKRSLVGIIAEPKEKTGLPVVILGAGILHRIGPSRISVALARYLAGLGHPTLRFDLSGIGDSPRIGDENLIATAEADVRDAIELMNAGDGVALVGYCSGADNAFYVGADDPRVRAAALFDPTVHATDGFRRRELMRRLKSPRSWWNVLSGRSLLLRVRERSNRALADKPPDYYGLLVTNSEDANRRAASFGERGARLLFVLSDGIRSYCNAPEQVQESLPTGYSPELFEVCWAPHLNHILSSRSQVTWFCESIGDWLARIRSAPTQSNVRAGPQQ